ncbi:MAG: cupredoxin domain-containing protein [Pirellulales bacterium]
MRTLLLTTAAALVLAVAHQAFAQLADPNVRGPIRRGAGATAEALGAPGVDERMERRQDRRDVARANDPDRWRLRYYNNEWWYYTPQSSWMYYRDNRWTPYDRAAYRPLRQRYTSGYRGVYTGRNDFDRFAFGKPGAPNLTVAIHDDSFEPGTIHVSPGTTVTWVNRGTHDHTITSADGNWDSGEIAPDGSYSARFKQPGTYHYVCDLHKDMKGAIVVADVSGAARDGRPEVNIDAQPGRGADVDIQGRRGGVDVDVPAADLGANVTVEPNAQNVPPANTQAPSLENEPAPAPTTPAPSEPAPDTAPSERPASPVPAQPLPQ